MAAKTSQGIKRDRCFNGKICQTSSRGNSNYFIMGYRMMKQFEEESVKNRERKGGK